MMMPLKTLLKRVFSAMTKCIVLSKKLLAVVLYCSSLGALHADCAFLVWSAKRGTTRPSIVLLQEVLSPVVLSSSSFDENRSENDGGDENLPLHEKFKTAAEKMMVEKTREKLEQDNVKSFLKRRPRKLPYEDARRWVQANLGVDTEEEFDDLVANGNLRTPYIPKRPEEYYTNTREWISWDHFLRGIFDERPPPGGGDGGSDSPPSPPSAVKPATGIFD